MKNQRTSSPKWKGGPRRIYRNGQLEKAYWEYEFQLCSLIKQRGKSMNLKKRPVRFPVRRRDFLAVFYGIKPSTFRTYIDSREQGYVPQDEIDTGLAKPDKVDCRYRIKIIPSGPHRSKCFKLPEVIALRILKEIDVPLPFSFRSEVVS
jgi:hypothetical protein